MGEIVNAFVEDKEVEYEQNKEIKELKQKIAKLRKEKKENNKKIKELKLKNKKLEQENHNLKEDYDKFDILDLRKDK